MADDIDPKEAAARRTAGRAARGGTDAPAKPRTSPRTAPLSTPKPAQPLTRSAGGSAPATNAGGSGPPSPPSGGTRTMQAAPEPAPSMRSFDSTRNVPATRPSPGATVRGMAFPELRPGPLPSGRLGPNAGGALGTALTIAPLAFDAGKEYVDRNYPRVQATEQAVSRETGVSPLAADAPPMRVPGRFRGQPIGGGAPHDAGLPLDVAADTFRGGHVRAPREEANLPAPPPPAARPAAPRRPATGPSDRMADVLNARELDRVGRVNRGQEPDRPPQFAKGGFVKSKHDDTPAQLREDKVQAKKAGMSFAAFEKSGKDKDRPAFAKGGMVKPPGIKVAAAGPGRPAGPPKAPKPPTPGGGKGFPAFLSAARGAGPAAPKASKPPAFPGAKGALPFSKGGMVKGKKC